MDNTPPRCPVHKTAMVAAAENYGTITMRCVLRGCAEKTTLSASKYEEIYGGKAKIVGEARG